MVGGGSAPIYARRSTEAGIVSFDFVDLTTGTAVKTYHGGQLNGGVFTLNTAPFYSDEIGDHEAFNQGTDFIKKHDVDFDLPFDKTLTIKGEILINYSTALNDTAGGGFGSGTKTTAIIKKWDGTTETTLLTIEGTEWGVADGAVRSKISTLGGTIPQTTFSRGETLRITMEVWVHGSGGTSQGTISFAFDPMSRTFANFATTDQDETSITFRIPFRIDL